MPPEGENHTGSQLDQDHSPETNGRMPVCRRCGSQTDGPIGRNHMPSERQMPRIREWLVAESKKQHIKRALEARGA
jgi:hypothetical protein